MSTVAQKKDANEMGHNFPPLWDTVCVMIPGKLDPLAPIVRLIPGAIFSIRQKCTEEGFGTLDHGSVNVFGIVFPWKIIRDEQHPCLTVYVPEHPAA